jgi:hypothetical protein
MCDAHGQLGEGAPERAFIFGGALPSGFENFVRLEGPAGVEQPLRLGEELEGRPFQQGGVELLHGVRRFPRQRAPERIAGPGIERAPGGVPIARRRR